MMDRRVFLKLTGLVAAASALEAFPVAAATGPLHVTTAEPFRDVKIATASPALRLAVSEPGTYRISGIVHLDEPLVEISGIANAQQISWSATDEAQPRVASFVSFEELTDPGLTPEIQVRGGRLESLSVVPIDFQ
jgi:hypothetical protein